MAVHEHFDVDDDLLTHIDAAGNDSPPIYIDNSTAANRAVNIPEFVNVSPNGIENIDVPASEFYRIVDEAMSLQAKGDNVAALERWQEALKLDPADARANNGMGIVLGLQGKPDDAIPYFRKAIQIDKDFFEAYYNLGIILSQARRAEEAIDAWQNTVRIRPKFSQGHEKLGYELYLRTKYAESLAQLSLALRDEPDRITALNLAASLLATCPDASIRNGAKALSFAEEANQITKEENPVILDTLSAAFAENGSFTQAIEVEQRALALATQQDDSSLATRVKAHLARYMVNKPLRITPEATAR